MEWLEETHKYEHEPQLKAFKDELEQFGNDALDEKDAPK